MNPHEFHGRIGRYWEESEQWWPDPPRPPAGAPNVVVFLLDDVGFAQIGAYGSDLDTPNFDRLAQGGLRYTNFHTTALCSPTRACVLTGRNHHSCGMGRIIQLATGFPGYHAMIPRSHGFMPEMLTPEGYAAWAVGKWHLTLDEETHLGATRKRWPLGRGFERFYGFFDGETHQFSPALVHDNHFVDPPGDYDTGYHLTADMADHAIEYIQDLRHVDPEKPFYLYFCPGACHSPHHVHPEWMAPYRGQFDEGWDVWRERTLARQIETGVLREGTRLSPRPEWVPAWDELSADEQTVYARYMEAFAGMLTHTDAQIGRVVDFIDRLGELDNTLIMVLSDNGASSEGGPEGSVNDVRAWNMVPRTAEEALERLDELGGPRMHNNYPWGWTVAGNTPFRRWKRETHEGGVADPLIVHWPAGIRDAGGVRRQYVHAIDLVPTMLEAIGMHAPDEIDGVEQAPIEGTSFHYTFDQPDAPERHTTQYYEMFGCRAIYHEGWKAVTYHRMMLPEGSFDEDHWELYDLENDPTELDDLSEQRPDKLRELVERWWVEAARYNVLPLDDRPLSELVLQRPTGTPPRSRYVYYPGGGRVPEVMGARLNNRSHAVTAEVDWPDGGAEGVLMAQGSILGGWTLFVRDGRLTYVHNLSSYREHRVSAELDLASGEHTLGFRFVKHDEGNKGHVHLLVDGEEVGDERIGYFTPLRFSFVGHGLTCGYDGTLAVVDDYRSPYTFTRGALRRVLVDVDGEPFVDAEGEAEVAVTTQ